jgi:hypothetical protein
VSCLKSDYYKDMVEIILENINAVIISTNWKDFEEPNLTYNEKEGTVTFKGHVLKVRQPKSVWYSFLNLQQYTDEDSRCTSFYRITPAYRVMHKVITYKNSFYKLADRIIWGSAIYEKPYQFVTYDEDQYEEDDLRYKPYVKPKSYRS